MTLLTSMPDLAWESYVRETTERGYAQTPPLLTSAECAELIALYESGRFRSRVDMARHRFGEGEYKYFDEPLPNLVAELRNRLYPHLARVANHWAKLLGDGEEYPAA